MIIAIDYDGTLFEEQSVDSSKPIGKIPYLIAELSKYEDIILWTCRFGESLDQAVKVCNEMNIRLSAINDNVDWVKELIKPQSRKIIYDILIDNSNMGFSIEETEKFLQNLLMKYI